VGSKTILSKFNEDIDSLIKKLSESTNHFVRCIKPNESRSPMTVDSVYMKKQIQYLGVFETIKIRQAIFPSRKIYEDFSRDYQQIYP
jgi:myosin heavy subunit